MIRIEQKEFEQTASVCMDKVRNGETLVITDEAEPIAELRPLATTTRSPIQRQIGWSKDLIEISDLFFDPLPDDELALWNGESPSPVFRQRTPRERRLGFLKDKIIVHSSFFDPMDEDELKLWEEGDPRSPI